MAYEFGYETAVRESEDHLLEELLDRLELEHETEDRFTPEWESPSSFEGQQIRTREVPADPVHLPACPTSGIPASGPITPFTPNRTNCSQAFGVANPKGMVAKAVARALVMMDNTIAELVNARRAVCLGRPPAYPLLGDVTADWLKNRLGVCIDDLRVWRAGTFVNGSVAEVIRRLIRVRNLIASNELRYVCHDAQCSSGDWAFVLIDPTCNRTPASIVRLCRDFWIARAGVDPVTQAEFQAQTIIHEASHLTHCTADQRGASIGVAECLAQFVAATNGSPIDPSFRTRCATSSRCKQAAEREIAESGAAVPGFRIVKVKIGFDPRNAVRLKGRPAARR
jgi:hypothetical protein